MRPLFFILFSFCLLAGSKGFSQQNSFANQAKKYYCTADQIEITSSAIIIHLGESPIEVDTLQVDQGGVYFTDEMVRCFYCRRPINTKNICEHSSCLAKN